MTNQKPGRKTSPSPTAAGLTSLRVTWEHARAQTGVVRALKVLSHANQKSGFDCPGCAWPDPAQRSLTEFCENGAKAILDEATTRRLDASFFAHHSISELQQKEERWLNAQGRLTRPLLKRPGATHYEECSYQEALELVADELAALDSPQQASFYTSGRTSNEAAFLYQLLVRSFGTNNLPDCSNLCHESSGLALKQSIGIGKGTVRLKDFEQADIIFVIGQNPGTNHPRMLSALREAKLAGATVISVNPLRETGLVRFSHPQETLDLLQGGVAISDHFLRVKVNGDQALFRGLCKCLLDAEPKDPEAIDRAFIKQYTEGIDAFEQQVRDSSWQEITRDSGIPQEQIEAVARMVRSSKSIICCWAMGLTQHKNAVATIGEVTNFLLLRGNIGRPGAGVCPVRGHSNVQGDRSVGITTRLPARVGKNLERRYGFCLAEAPGLDAVGTIQAMQQGELKVFVSLGGNFLSACPDTEITQLALARTRLSVQISTKLNRSHLFTGQRAVILPCLARSESDAPHGTPQFVSVENSMGVVHRSQGSLQPAHPDLKSEAEIVARLGELLVARKAGSTHIPWSKLATDYDAIRDEIAAVIPSFEDYNSHLRDASGFELDNGPRERRFTTQSGKAQFVSSPLNSVQAEEGELLLMTIRSHDQFNTTVYSNNDRYRGVNGTRHVLLLNAGDMSRRGLKSGDSLRITSHFQGESKTLLGFTAMSYDVPEGAAAAYFPEANPLVFVESFADGSRTPACKSVRISLEKVAPSL